MTQGLDSQEEKEREDEQEKEDTEEKETKEHYEDMVDDALLGVMDDVDDEEEV